MGLSLVLLLHSPRDAAARARQQQRGSWQAGGVTGLLAQLFASLSKDASETDGHASLPMQLYRSRAPSLTLLWLQPPPSTARGVAFGTTSRFTGWVPLQVRSA